MSFLVEQPHNHTIEMVVLSTDIVYNAQMNDIYQEHILDHANNPRNKTSTPTPNPSLKGRGTNTSADSPDERTGLSVCGQGDNPSCGDEGEMCVWCGPSPLWGEDGRGALDFIITNVQWSGRGCAISQASMSMMSELLIGKNIKELKLMMPGDVYKMLGIQITPSRVNCALLSYRALENILLKIML